MGEAFCPKCERSTVPQDADVDGFEGPTVWVCEHCEAVLGMTTE